MIPIVLAVPLTILPFAGLLGSLGWMVRSARP
jgi:uncharacterized membrane protein YjjB (DUF3815 family)